MASVKWIKLAVDIFDNRKIKQIERMPEGDALIVVWLKLLVLAGNTNDGGLVYFTREIPYTEQLLANEFNRPLSTIQLALNTFQRFGMIEIIEDIIHISNWEKYQNVDGMEKIREQGRKRVAEFRQRQRLALGSMVCQYCGASATGYDHIIPISRGGSDTEENKVPCCKECNRIKNDKPLVDFLNNNRERVNDEIIAANLKLCRYVTLRNVTNRYEVTQSNAIEEDIEVQFIIIMLVLQGNQVLIVEDHLVAEHQAENRRKI